MTPAEGGEQPDGKQRGRNDKQDRQRHEGLSSITRMSAPISAAVSKTPTQRSGQTYETMSASPICFTVNAFATGGAMATDVVFKIAQTNPAKTATATATPPHLNP